MQRNSGIMLCAAWIGVAIGSVQAQLPNAMIGQAVPRDVRQMYHRGLQQLVKTQAADGSWRDGQQGPGVTGMCVMAFLASGEDPNFGQYRQTVRKGLRSMLKSQDKSTGYFGPSMYHHGFAMLALSEAYGCVDERRLWDGDRKGQVSMAEALQLAVRCAITSQKKNPVNGWRYSPDDTSADTSVSGAVLVGMLAARNAGIAVPDTAIDNAVKYFKSMTSNGGQVGYSGGMGGFGESTARSSIATLVYALSKNRKMSEFEATLDYLVNQVGLADAQSSHGYVEYTRYYRAQALFQGDTDAWDAWNKLLIRQLKNQQQADGSLSPSGRDTVRTALNLLSLALNFRLLPIYER